MPRVGFEPMTPAFERAKTIQALDCAAIVIGQMRRKLTSNMTWRLLSNSHIRMTHDPFPPFRRYKTSEDS
jgi:hypothetical protein